MTTKLEPIEVAEVINAVVDALNPRVHDDLRGPLRMYVKDAVLESLDLLGRLNFPLKAKGAGR